MAELPTSVLFACSLNIVRSPMAEGFLKHLHGHHIFVDSVGVETGDPDGFVVEVMREKGIDLSRHRPKLFDQLDDLSFDLIITLSPEAHHVALDLTARLAAEVEYWPMEHPGGIEGTRELQLEAYRRVRDAIWTRIHERFPIPSTPGG